VKFVKLDAATGGYGGAMTVLITGRASARPAGRQYLRTPPAA